MREILFRGKRLDSGQWVEGGYKHEKVGEYTTDVFIIESLTVGVFENHRVVPNTVGQYTGLTDKNGKKIFEGDILHFKTYQGGGFACPIGTDVYYKVLFGHCNPEMNTLTHYVGFWALDINYENDDLYQFGKSINYLINSHGACVIGNIHDNPELLKGGEG